MPDFRDSFTAREVCERKLTGITVGWGRVNKAVLCTAKKRGKEPRGFTTVRGAPQNGDGRFRDHAPDGSAALQNLYFFKRGGKNFRKRGKCTKKRATRNRLVYRDDAQGDLYTGRRENTSRRH